MRIKQQGFTLMEIVLSTAIFATTLTLMLVLFNYTLKINRSVESVRQASQDTRNFAELIVREIRNGDIDYGTNGSIDATNCPVASYDALTNQHLALVNHNGDRECFFLSGTDVKVTKLSVLGAVTTETINPPGSSISPATFRIYVRPTTDPRIKVGGFYPGVQPFVALIMNITVRVGDATTTIPYQTTVSTDNYDIPHK